MLVEEGTADRAGTGIGPRRLDPVLLRHAVDISLHRRRRRTVGAGRTRHGRGDKRCRSARSPVGQPADDARRLGARRVDRAHHLRLPDQNLVQQPLELGGDPWIDQRRIRLLQHVEQRQPAFGRHDVLALGRQELLCLEPADDLGPGGWRANALGLLQPLPEGLILTKRQAFCIASISVPSL